MHPIEHFFCQNSFCLDYGIRGKGNLCFWIRQEAYVTLMDERAMRPNLPFRSKMF